MRPLSWQALALVSLAGLIVPAAGWADEAARLAIVRSQRAEQQVPAAWGADTYAREVELWVHEAGGSNVPFRVLDGVELTETRTTYDAVVVPFPDFDAPGVVPRLMALVDQARRVLLVGAPFGPAAGFAERLRVVCGAPACTLLPDPEARHLVTNARSFLGGEVSPATRVGVRAGAPSFVTSGSKAVAWYVAADGRRDERLGDPDRSAAMVAFSCGGTEILWSGVPFSALTDEAGAGGGARLVANVAAWLAGAPWLGRSPWRDDRSFPVLVDAEVQAPFDGVTALLPTLRASRARGSFVVAPTTSLPAALRDELASAGDVYPSAAVRATIAASTSGVRADCDVLGDPAAQTADDTAALLLAELDVQAGRGAPYPLRLHAGCLLGGRHSAALALFLAGARQRPAWFTTYADLEAWAKAREAVRVERVAGGFRVVNTGEAALTGFPLVAYRFGALDLAALGRRALVLPRDDGGATLVLDLAPHEVVDLPATGR